MLLVFQLLCLVDGGGQTLQKSARAFPNKRGHGWVWWLGINLLLLGSNEEVHEPLLTLDGDWVGCCCQAGGDPVVLSRFGEHTNSTRE